MPTVPDKPTSALSIDVEGFAESHAQSVKVPAALLEASRMDAEIESNLEVALELLSQHNCLATFFFLGRIARTSPQLVRRVADAGHEVACHSLWHLRLTGQSPGELRAAVREAKSLLEDASGTPVVGFRAPEFSIGEDNPWVFDELIEAGFTYDSSVVPTSIHDIYGMKGTPQTIFCWPNGLIEFPLPVTRVLGASLPIGGGGYFRLYPLSWTLRHFRRRERRGEPVVFYIHPYEIGSEAPMLPGLAPWRRLRHYIRLSKGQERLDHLLGAIRFTTMAEVLNAHGFPTTESTRASAS